MLFWIIIITGSGIGKKALVVPLIIQQTSITGVMQGGVIALFIQIIDIDQHWRKGLGPFPYQSAQ